MAAPPSGPGRHAVSIPTLPPSLPLILFRSSVPILPPLLPSFPPSLPPCSTEHTEAKIDITLLLEDEVREAHATEEAELEEDEEVGEDEGKAEKEGAQGAQAPARMFCSIM